MGFFLSLTSYYYLILVVVIIYHIYTYLDNQNKKENKFIGFSHIRISDMPLYLQLSKTFENKNLIYPRSFKVI